MSETIIYDEQTTASPGEVNTSVLGVELSSAIPGVTAWATLVGSQPAGQRLSVLYSETLTAGQTTTALGVVHAHDAAALTDVTDGKFEVPMSPIIPNPGNNQWTDIPGASFPVAEGRVVRGTVDVSCYVGTTATPCGQHLDFECTRQVGQAVRISSGGDPNGSVSGFRSELTDDGPGVVKLRIRRRQTPTIQAQVTIVRTTEFLP